jgi:hypothetical protein
MELLHWVNSLGRIPECLLVSSYQDLQDGSVFLAMTSDFCEVPIPDPGSAIDRLLAVFRLLQTVEPALPPQLRDFDRLAGSIAQVNPSCSLGRRLMARCRARMSFVLKVCFNILLSHSNTRSRRELSNQSASKSCPKFRPQLPLGWSSRPDLPIRLQSVDHLQQHARPLPGLTWAHRPRRRGQ